MPPIMGIAAPAAMLPMDLGREVISRREPKVRFLPSAPGSWWHNEWPERGSKEPFMPRRLVRLLSDRSGDLRWNARQRARCADGGHLPSDGLRQTTADLWSQLHR